MNIANRIQHLRKTKGISQEELADKVGVSRQAVSKWESDHSVPDIDKIIILSDYFEVTTDYIMKGIEEIIQDEKSINNTQNHILNITKSRKLIFVGTVFEIIGVLIIAVICLIASMQLENTVQWDTNIGKYWQTMIDLGVFPILVTGAILLIVGIFLSVKGVFSKSDK